MPTAATGKQRMGGPKRMLPAVEACLLNEDLLTHILELVGPKEYWFVASVNKFTRNTYLSKIDDSKQTLVDKGFASKSRMDFWLRHRRYRNSPRSYHVAGRVSIEALEYLKDSKWNGKFRWDRNTTKAAAHAGRLTLLRYLMMNGCPWNTSTICEAANGGQLYLVRWFQENFPFSFDDHRVHTSAIFGGHLHIIKWFQMQGGHVWSREDSSNAAGRGHIHILKWAFDNDFVWSADTCAQAARFNEFECLKWLKAHNCPWDSATTCFAAAEGHLELLKWAVANGCPMDTVSCISSAGTRHPNVVQWLREQE